MDQRSDVRASDDDRDRVVERLRLALEEGRLSLNEYDERLGRVTRARSQGDLIPLYADLHPTMTTPGSFSGELTVPLGRPSDEPVSGVRALPTWLRVVWVSWLTAVLVNLTIWVLVAVGTGDLPYFWPMWVAGPSAAALVGLTAIERVSRN